MKTYKLKKTLAVTICVCFIMASFLSTIFIITHEHHQCTGESCTVCCQLENAKNTLKQLGAGAASGAFFLPALTFLILCVITCFSNIKTASLVTLKIRMDN